MLQLFGFALFAMSLGHLKTLKSRAWSSTSLKAGAEHCANMSGMPLSADLSKEQLIQRLKDSTVKGVACIYFDIIGCRLWLEARVLHR